MSAQGFVGDFEITAIAAGDNNIGNVDLASAIPAGTNAIGKLAANSGVDIGDVDVTSIAAGANVIGKVGIDQTTPGTNDSVSVATAQGAGAAIGATSGAAVTTDANGTIQQYLRGLVVLSKAALVDVNSAIVADVEPAVAASAGLRLMGFSAAETAGSTAKFRLINGATVAGGVIVYVVTLAASESRGEWFPDGIDCVNGISIDWVSGTVDVHVIYKDVE